MICTDNHDAGCGGNREPDPVEYDLDNEDEDWLKSYNIGRSRLNDMLFEKMLYKLELACAEATDTALSAAGAFDCAVGGVGGFVGCWQPYTATGLHVLQTSLASNCTHMITLPYAAAIASVSHQPLLCFPARCWSG